MSIPARLALVPLVLATGVALAPGAGAGTQSSSQIRTVTVRPTDWTTSVVIDRFDPALGQLTGIDIRLEGTLEADAGVENTGDTPIDLTATAGAHVQVERAGTAWSVAADPTAGFNRHLEEYDGTTDFGGPSGERRDLRTDTASTLTMTAAPDLAPFLGTGTIILDVSATGTSSASGAGGEPVASAIDVRAGAEIEVIYRFVSDDRPPDAPTITAAPAAVTSDLTPSVSFAVLDEPTATTTCQLVRPGPDDPWIPCASPWTVTLPAGTNGDFAMSVRATDAAGNVGGASTAAFLVDTDVPNPPVILTTPVSPSQATDPTWTFSTDPDTTTTCWVDGDAPAPCAHTFTDFLAPDDQGVHTFHVVATDTAGNPSAEATGTYVLDRQPPPPPEVVTAAPSPSSDTTPTWTVDPGVGNTVACSIDGDPYVACDPVHTADLTLALDGPHTLAVRATDTAGNVGDPLLLSYLLDRIGPTAPTVLGPAAVGNDTSPIFTFTFLGEAAAHARCQVDLEAPVDCDAGTFEPALTIDAVYVVQIWGIDVAGNPGEVTTVSYRLDTMPPPTPTITGRPAEASPDDQPSWSFTVGANRRAECSVDGGPWVSCADTHTADLAGAPDGLHRFAVHAIDLAGNIGDAAEDTFVLDRSAPAAPTITSSPDTPGRDRSPSWTFDAPADTTTECSTNTTTWAPCTAGITIDLPVGVTDATVDLWVRAIDSAGNASAPATSSYTVDLTAPAAPEITASPASPGNRTSATWSFTVEDEADAECALDGGAWESCSGGFVVIFGAGSDGRHTLEIRATDAAGNTSESATGEYVLDTTAPPAPVITGGPAPASTDDTPRWTFTTEIGATAECRVDDGDWMPCDVNLEVDFGDQPDGTHALEVRATDAVGNTGPVAATAYLLDRSAPTAPSFTAVPATPGRDRSPTWSFAAEEGAAAECSFDGRAWTGCDRSYEADLGDADDGAYELAVRTTDAAGNRSEAVIGTYVLDTRAPARPGLAGPTGPTNDTTPEWHITVDPGSSSECAVDGGPFVPCGSLLTATLADGTHTVEVRAVDAAGNVSPVAAAFPVVDTVAPTPPGFSHLPTPSNPTWSVLAPAGAVAECSLDSGPWSPCPAVVGGASTARLEVRAVDAAGNRSAVVAAPQAAIVVDVPVTVTAGPAPGGSDDSLFPAAAMTVATVTLPVVSSVVDALPDIAVGTDVAAAVVADLGPETALGNLLPVLPPEVALLIQNAVERTTLPVVLIGVVIAFLAIQDRLDRRDPKLALAPLRPEPEYLEFR